MTSAQAQPPAPPRYSRKRRFTFALIAVFGSTVLCLICLEIAFAIIQPETSYKNWHAVSFTYLLDDDTDWKLEPRQYPWGQVNEHFFRGHVIPPERIPGRLRIAVLGGSAAYSLCVRDNEAWPAQLEGLLANQLGRPVEVVNFGTPGYSTWQCLNLLKARALRWQPDVVLLYEMYNDSLTFRHADRNHVIHGWKLNAHANYIGPVAHPHWFYDSCGVVLPHLTDYVRMLLVNVASDRVGKKIKKFWVDLTYESRVHPEGLAFYRDNRMAIAKVLEDAGNIPLIVITQASIIHADNALEEKYKIFYHYRGMNHERLVEAYRLARDIDAKLARDCPNVTHIKGHEIVPASLDYFLDEVHFNLEGNTLFAHGLARELVQRSLLDRPRSYPKK